MHRLIDGQKDRGERKKNRHPVVIFVLLSPRVNQSINQSINLLSIFLRRMSSWTGRCLDMMDIERGDRGRGKGKGKKMFDFRWLAIDLPSLFYIYRIVPFPGKRRGLSWRDCRTPSINLLNSFFLRFFLFFPPPPSCASVRKRKGSCLAGRCARELGILDKGLDKKGN